MLKKVEHRSPWTFVPTLAFILGLGIAVVQLVYRLIYKSMGISNEAIGVLTLLGLPIAFNVVIAPFVDSVSTKRKWLILTQYAVILCLGLLAVSMILDDYVFPISVGLLSLLSLLIGVFAVPQGGFYVDALTKKEQGFFVGINTASIRLGLIIVTGFLVMVSGKFGEQTGKMEYGWAMFFGLCTVVTLMITLWHQFVLPYPPKVVESEKPKYFVVFQEFFAQKQVLVFVVFILIYRLGEGLLATMAEPFLLDGFDEGGMGMRVSDVAFMRGTLGMVSSIVGGLIAGFFLKSKHYKGMILVLAACMTGPNIFYVWLAHYQPTEVTQLDFSFLPGLFGSDAQWIYALNLKAQLTIIAEQFGYGMGYAAFLFVVFRIASESKYRATTISIAMAIQNVGWTLSGVVSGFIQARFGYTWLFILSIILSVPGFLLLMHIVKNREL